MVKFSFVAVVFFVLGVFATTLYNNQVGSKDTAFVEKSNASSPSVFAHAASDRQAVTADNPLLNDSSLKITRVDLNLFKSPKTPFEFFEVLASLKSASAAELKKYISSLGRDKIEARRQVAWLLAGKYPDEALDFLTTLMNRGDVDLAKLVLQCVGQNHAKRAWDWIGANESEMDNMFSGNVSAKYEFKLFVLNFLALVPEQKWAAYNEVQILTANGPRKGDKYNVLSVAMNASKDDPEDAINRSMSGLNGSPDPMLFNGAVSVIVEKDLARAKDLVLQHQDMAEGSSASKIAYNLMQHNQFNDAYNFMNSLTKPELKSYVINTVSERAMANGLDRAKEFANAIASDEERASTVHAMVIQMAVSGQPVSDQLDLMDSALQQTPIDKKAFNYAYTMRDWSKTNPSEFNAYMSDLRSRDKPLADAVEQSFQYMPKK